MINRILLPLLFAFLSVPGFSQDVAVKVTEYIALPEDSLMTLELISSLNEFLTLVDKPNEENHLVLASERVETYVFIDEIKDVQKSKAFEDDFFYKPYLTNVVPIDSNKYLIQVSYLGTHENESLIRASFDIIAHERDGSFVFSSPLIRNTRNWKTIIDRGTTIHYQDSINRKEVSRMTELTAFFDEKLHADPPENEYYFCKNSTDLLKLMGVSYKSDYNGKEEGYFLSSYEDRYLVMYGAEEESFDPHDLWHNRLSLVTSRRKVNHAVDEGIACLYGGTWGVTWEELFVDFQAQIDFNEATDWLKLREEKTSFATGGRTNLTDFMSNALFVKKIDAENGFEAVWELLNAKGEKEYFEVLEKWTGITKENYNEEVLKLIREEWARVRPGKRVGVIRNLNLELAEKDRLTSSTIEESLNGFLTEAMNRNYSSKYVDTAHLKKYEFFFNKLSGIGNNTEHTSFNPPSVLKSFSHKEEKETYRLTVAFTGIRDSVPFVYQVTELTAVPYQGHYRFYCPFEENTKDFNRKTFDDVTYYYSGSIDESKAIEFAEFKNELSTLTGAPKSRLDYYCFQNLDELLKSYGFLYSAKQCNFLCYDLGFTDNEGFTYLTGTNNENYVFGYLGEYLYYNLPNEDEMYWPFIQGVSTYYGGYGLSYDNMDELKLQFRKELNENPDVDFLEEFKKGRKSSVERHFSYYVMSAFLCEEILKKKGFDDVLTLSYSGNSGELFFENLKSILDIDESNFHETIVQLIN